MGNYQTAVKNLTKKGADANPNGRPKKGYSITEMMKEMLGTKPEVKQALGNVIIKKALEGDITAIKTVWQYMDGMPQQSVELTGDKSKPLYVRLPERRSLDTTPETD